MVSVTRRYLGELVYNVSSLICFFSHSYVVLVLLVLYVSFEHLLQVQITSALAKKLESSKRSLSKEKMKEMEENELEELAI